MASHINDKTASDNSRTNLFSGYIRKMNTPSLVAVSLQRRRRFLSQLSLLTIFSSIPGAFAEELIRTPRQTEGPFYPAPLPLNTENVFIVVNDPLTPATGEITYLSGRILDPRGEPIRNALVEIWQTDKNGIYLHSG